MQSSSDAHSSKNELSSTSTRTRKPPSHLQDFRCYNNTRTITTPYPLTNYISYSNLSEPFQAFMNIVTNTPLPQRYYDAKR